MKRVLLDAETTGLGSGNVVQFSYMLYLCYLEMLKRAKDENDENN